MNTFNPTSNKCCRFNPTLIQWFFMFIFLIGSPAFPSFVLRRVMGMRSCDSRCLFSGSKGEVCCIEPLRSPPDFRDHPITHYSLLAMASLTKVCRCQRSSAGHNRVLIRAASGSDGFVFSPQILVIGLKPSLKVWMTFPYNKVWSAVCMYESDPLTWRGIVSDVMALCCIHLPWTAIKRQSRAIESLFTRQAQWELPRGPERLVPARIAFCSSVCSVSLTVST